jgi:hypothetical protein
MSVPTAYRWESALVFAILGTDEAPMCSHIYAALAAIVRRRLRPADGEEDLALMNAEAGLQILITETTTKTF